MIEVYITIIMTKYGSTDEMEKLAWGGTKSSTPATVTSVQNTVTDVINLILNSKQEYRFYYCTYCHRLNSKPSRFRDTKILGFKNCFEYNADL
jgi:hypothetical protein